MEFNIGDRVKIKAYEDLPEELQYRAIARMTKQTGTVEDKFFSEREGKWLYILNLDNFKKSGKLWTDDYLEAIKEEISYCHEFDYLDNVVVARFYEIKDDVKTEIGRGHGHIIHAGAIGVAQASSYALKKIFENLNDGKLTKYE